MKNRQNRFLPHAFPVAVILAAGVCALPAARADYVERNLDFQATANDTWEVADLGGAPYRVPANAVVEVAIRNTRAGVEYWGGVRAVGSALDRRFHLHEAEGGGVDVVVLHVQADASSQFEIYSDQTTYVQFTLLGYWDSGTYVETYQSFTAGADASWQNHNLGTYGVSADEVAEIVLVNTNGVNEREAGVRTNGSALDRRLDLHKAEAGGVDLASMFVQADNTANATVEVYAEVNADVVCYLVG